MTYYMTTSNVSATSFCKAKQPFSGYLQVDFSQTLTEHGRLAAVRSNIDTIHITYSSCMKINV